jgi:microcystin-dependent protein
MALTPFIGEIVMYSFAFPPKGWALANGQFLPINQNQALFSILGTTYGGDGQVNFQLPDLRGRVAMHTGDGHTLGERGGQEFHTVTLSEMPAHNHFAQANNTNGLTSAAGVTPGPTKAAAQAIVSLQGGGTTAAQIYGTGNPTGTMAPSAVRNIGGSQAHENRQPYGVLSFCIALVGVFPSQN